MYVSIKIGHKVTHENDLFYLANMGYFIPSVFDFYVMDFRTFTFLSERVQGVG